jgi:hypothetical protein
MLVVIRTVTGRAKIIQRIGRKADGARTGALCAIHVGDPIHTLQMLSPLYIHDLEYSMLHLELFNCEKVKDKV